MNEYTEYIFIYITVMRFGVSNKPIEFVCGFQVTSVPFTSLNVQHSAKYVQYETK